jgi:hypothetical protein
LWLILKFWLEKQEQDWAPRLDLYLSGGRKLIFRQPRNGLGKRKKRLIPLHIDPKPHLHEKPSNIKFI